MNRTPPTTSNTMEHMMIEHERMASALRQLELKRLEQSWFIGTNWRNVVGDASISDKQGLSVVSVANFMQRMESLLTPAQWAGARCKGGVSVGGKLKKFTVEWDDEQADQ